MTAMRRDCAAVAGKSTLNRLELSRPQPTRYHKIACEEAAIEALSVTLLLEAHKRPPKQIILDLDTTDDPLQAAALVDAARRIPCVDRKRAWSPTVELETTDFSIVKARRRSEPCEQFGTTAISA